MRLIWIEKSSSVILVYLWFWIKSHTWHVLSIMIRRWHSVPDCCVVVKCSCACFFLMPASARACISNDELRLLKSTSVGVSAGVNPLMMNEERSWSSSPGFADLRPFIRMLCALDRLKYSCAAASPETDGRERRASVLTAGNHRWRCV